MMKRLLTLMFCLCAGFLTAQAQKPDTAKAIVHYKFSHLRDTTKPNEPYTENMILFLGRTASAYKSYDRKLQDAMMRKQIAQQIAANAGTNGPITVKRGGPRITNNEYYQFPGTGKLVRKESLINSYLIEEPLPVIKWKISNDTASFSGLKCQKATGILKGREYTAWFCPDLPFHSGPWKLNGLPGLIIEAYDAKKQVMFKFDGMDDPAKMEKPAAAAGEPGTIQSGSVVVKMIGMENANTDPNVIALPTNGIKATEKEFQNLKEAMKKDPQAFIQSAMGGSGANFKGNISGVGNVSRNVQFNATPEVINNPLELPEKK